MSPEAGPGGPPDDEAGPGGPPDEEAGPGEQPDATTEARRRPARCDVCGDVIESRHPWDVQTCSCGRLTLSGGPKHRQVHWRAEPGTGWTDLTESSADDDSADEDGGANRASAGGGPSWLRPRGADGRLDVAAVDGLMLQQELDDAVERGPMVGQKLCSPLLGFAQ